MSERKRVLVADDDGPHRRIIARMLQRIDCDHIAVSDAYEAEQQLQEGSFDLLIADVKMPGNENLELIRRLSLLAEGMPAILMTGFPSLRTAIHAVQLPVIAYLVKPIDPTEFNATVQKALGRKNPRHFLREARERLAVSRDELQRMETQFSVSLDRALEAPLATARDLSFHNVSNALRELLLLTESLVESPERDSGDNNDSSQQLASLIGLLRETVAVLESTRHSFKSRDLAALRNRLEQILRVLD